LIVQPRSHQVVKQADLVLALHWCGDAFTDEEKANDFAYYEALTVRHSSLSACTQAIVAAEVGQLDLAHAYLGEAALMDLRDLEHNTRDGVHIASLAGAWLAAVAGFGGTRDHQGRLTFAPGLPPQLHRLSFRLRFDGRRLKVETARNTATYTLLAGEPLNLRHHGTRKPRMVARSDPVASITARISSAEASHGGSASSGIGSEEPEPRGSNRITLQNDARRR
jgi:alpha,alpha-trehalose phosphorylase